MIHWSLTLTGNQIALLRAYRHRQFGVPFDSTHDSRGYLAGTRTLCRQGLMEHRTTLQKPDRLGNRYTDVTRSGVFLTERGQFLLKVIEQDIAQFMSADVPKRREKRRIA